MIPMIAAGNVILLGIRWDFKSEIAAGISIIAKMMSANDSIPGKVNAMVHPKRNFISLSF
jgi:hypothetical protein